MKQKSFFVIFNIIVLGMFVMAATPSDINASEKPLVHEVKSPDALIGFKDWKQKRVFGARAALDEFKSQQHDPNENLGAKEKEATQVAGSNPVPAPNSKVVQPEAQVSQAQKPVDKKLGEKLRQLEFNLEISQGLTIHDYFALYLKNKSKEDMVLAVQKLSPEELSELMLAYKQSLYGSPKTLPKEETSKTQKLLQ